MQGRQRNFYEKRARKKQKKNEKKTKKYRETL